MKEPVFDNLLKRIPILVYRCVSFPVVKNSPVHAGDTGDNAPIPRRGDPLEEKVATHSSILAWDSPWTEEPGGLQSMWSQSQI